ncbi:Undecaprenyl-phosphate galactosephosphotransferase [Hyphomicrobium sulfonivorans]|uniref:Undecaprenyl-phosphate galactosephosphotransferase n=1 Tax=Hyphomicrobium sulfonivorans TaxID=121290 RepID=A0A125NWB7_HYPSL|nr:Undecaprenyl-phosphate galactosephosphotransferase [Hyphomicrobium sulfonivorans]
MVQRFVLSGHARKLIVLLVDVVIVVIATVFALLLQDNLKLSPERLLDLLPYLASSGIAAFVVLVLLGSHRTIWRFSAMADYLRIVAASFAIVVLATVATFLLQRLDGVPRSLPIMQALLIVVMLVGARVWMRVRHASRNTAAASHVLPVASNSEETVLLVGVSALTDLFLRAASQLSENHLKIAGILGRNDRQRGRHLHSYPVLGVPEEVTDVLHRLEVHGIFVDRILVLLPFTDLSVDALSALLAVEKTSSIRVDFLAEQLGLAGPGHANENQAAGSVENLPTTMAALEQCARRPYFLVKRLCDFTAALVLSLIVLPLGAVIALLVAFDVGYPVLFWQQRPGRHGRPFRIYKFRTMRGAHDHRGRRIPDDQRTSVIGHFLRRTRLDEIPQLYNILVGDMAFIGPRPLLAVDQSREFDGRLLVRPGLTGWAQVAGGRDISAKDKAALDIWYVRNASLLTDVKIVLRTVPMILFGERADQRLIDAAWRDLHGSQVRDVM